MPRAFILETDSTMGSVGSAMAVVIAETENAALDILAGRHFVLPSGTSYDVSVRGKGKYVQILVVRKGSELQAHGHLQEVVLLVRGRAPTR